VFQFARPRDRPSNTLPSLHPHTLQVEHALWLMREALAGGYEMPTAAFNNLLQVRWLAGPWLLCECRVLPVGGMGAC